MGKRNVLIVVMILVLIAAGGFWWFTQQDAAMAEDATATPAPTAARKIHQTAHREAETAKAHRG